MNRRRGISLIEMVVVITLAAAMLSAAALLLHALLGARDAAQAGLVDRAAAARLAEAFRDDAHRATAFRPGEAAGDAPAPWMFDLGGRLIALYQVEGAAVVREMRQEGAASSREVFALGIGAEASAALRSEGGVDWVSLTVVSKSRPAEVRVDARLGAQRRFERVEGEPGP